jgi:hypothetical protein
MHVGHGPWSLPAGELAHGEGAVGLLGNGQQPQPDRPEVEPVVDAQTPPRRMFGEAFDVPLPLTTLRNGAMVDVIAQPVELRDDADR